MKKFFIILSIGCLMLLPILTLAATDPLSDLNLAREGVEGTKASASGPDFIDYIGGIIRAIIGILGVIFVCYIVYAGYLWTTAGDSSDVIKKAKTIMIQSIIGLVIAVSAYAIADYVMNVVIARPEQGPIWGTNDIGVTGTQDLTGQGDSFQDYMQ